MSDKSEILDFCRVLYPEGDYFEDTFDSWLAGKNHVRAMSECGRIACALAAYRSNQDKGGLKGYASIPTLEGAGMQQS